jgi:serine/threonine-protein kinase
MLQDEQVLGVSELIRVGERDAVMMDYVEGVDLADLIKKAAVPPKALAEMGAEIAGTLFRAHNAKHPSNGQPLNVIHRDIKPANVMVTGRGGVRLLDFGVARAAFSDRESQTQGLVLGTLNYFPPEILAGNEPTRAVDIYGLGLLLWECAAGKEWGTPQAQQKRFEKRVDQRLTELSAEYKELLLVMRSILQWDPELRPDGGAVERALLHAASQCTGSDLRVWAREAVPPMLAEREKGSKGKKDDLGMVGQTLQVQSLSSSDEEKSAQMQAISASPPRTVSAASPARQSHYATAPKTRARGPNHGA